jgi:hypothetical protein
VKARLAALWARWVVIAHAIGNFQARVLLSVFYFVLIPPFAVIVRLFKDPLELRPRPRQALWRAVPPRDASLTGARRQS